MKYTITLFLISFLTLNSRGYENKIKINTSDLPVIITLPTTAKSESLVLFISGDGGWNNFDKDLSQKYAEQGFTVVGLNSLKYFWEKKSPEQAALDVSALLKNYMGIYKKNKIILCGYSFGADVLPFIYNRLPVEMKNKVGHIQLLSPASFTDFEIHISDLFSTKNSVRSYQVGTEIQKINNIPVTCFYGREESEKPLTSVKLPNFKILILNGDHHYNNNTTSIVRSVVN